MKKLHAQLFQMNLYMQFSGKKIYFLSQICVALSPFTYIPITHKEIRISLRELVLLSRRPTDSSEDFAMRLTSKDTVLHIIFPNPSIQDFIPDF